MSEKFKDILYKCVKLCVLSYAPQNVALKAKIRDLNIVRFVSRRDVEFLAAIDNEHLYLCFTGTELNEIKDIKRDLLFFKKKLSGKMKVHRGFYEGFRLVEQDVYDVVSQWKGNRSLILCGHSLGGALAMIASYFLTLKDNKPYMCMTFGQPRTGNAKFARFCTQNFDMHRFYIDVDIVPKIPPAFWGYKHGGNPRPIITVPKFMSKKWIKKQLRYMIMDFIVAVVTHVGFVLRSLGYYLTKSLVYHRMKNYKRFIFLYYRINDSNSP